MKKSSNSTIKIQDIIENYILIGKIIIKIDLNNCKVIFEDDHLIFNDNPQEHEQQNTFQLMQQFINDNSVDEIEKVNSATHYMQYLTKDGKVLNAYECGICSKIFTQSYNFIKHLFVHTKKRIYICTECGNGFYKRSTLTQHRVIHSNERPHVCEICNKNFNRISTLISHRKIHSDTKSYICSICSRGFHQKGNLKNHIYTHTNQRPYKCTLCEKGYNQKSNLVFHMKTSHSVKCGRIWKCEQCNIEFPKRALLRAHEIEKHNKNNQINLCETMTNQNANSPSSSHTDNEFQINNKPGLCIDAIDTYEMQRARQNGDIPLAILHLLQGDTIIVRVIDYGNKSLLGSIHGTDYNLEACSTSIAQSRTRFTTVASIHQIVDENSQSKFKIYEPNDNYINNNSLEEINNEEVPTIQPININFSHLNFPESIENKENNGNALNSNNSNINNNQQIEQIQEQKQHQPKAIALQNDLNFNCLTPITSNCNADSTRNAFQNIATNGYLTPTNICEDENSRNSSHSINFNKVFDDLNLNEVLNEINFENNIDTINFNF